MQVNCAMVFAAGLGTRMRPLTNTMPKPLIEVSGKPLIDYTLALLDGVSKVVVNTHYCAEQLETHLDGRDVICIREKQKLLETGGGLKNALPILGCGPILTLNSDAIFIGQNPVTKLREAWDPLRMDALLTLIPMTQTVGYGGVGDFFLDNGRIERRGMRDEAPFVYGGAQIIKTKLLADIQKAAFSLNIIWDQMIAGGRAFGLPHDGRWVDVGRPEGIAVAEKILADV
ncbi:MAG: nucleotidyltransferase family protein [Amylibacter sp.]|nr:nucleotidyltransferase family protein [Amylibacter sp.]